MHYIKLLIDKGDQKNEPLVSQLIYWYGEDHMFDIDIYISLYVIRYNLTIMLHIRIITVFQIATQKFKDQDI